MSERRNAISHVVLWVALILNIMLIIGTAVKVTQYMGELAVGVSLNTQSLVHHDEKHAQKDKYEDEFRSEVRQSLRDIKAQTAKD